MSSRVTCNDPYQSFAHDCDCKCSVACLSNWSTNAGFLLDQTIARVDRQVETSRSLQGRVQALEECLVAQAETSRSRQDRVQALEERLVAQEETIRSLQDRVEVLEGSLVAQFEEEVQEIKGSIYQTGVNMQGLQLAFLEFQEKTTRQISQTHDRVREVRKSLSDSRDKANALKVELGIRLESLRTKNEAIGKRFNDLAQRVERISSKIDCVEEEVGRHGEWMTQEAQKRREMQTTTASTGNDSLEGSHIAVPERDTGDSKSVGQQKRQFPLSAILERLDTVATAVPRLRTAEESAHTEALIAGITQKKGEEYVKPLSAYLFPYRPAEGYSMKKYMVNGHRLVEASSEHFRTEIRLALEIGKKESWANQLFSAEQMSRVMPSLGEGFFLKSYLEDLWQRQEYLVFEWPGGRKVFTGSPTTRKAKAVVEYWNRKPIDFRKSEEGAAAMS